jgi:hypothetical protein
MLDLQGPPRTLQIFGFDLDASMRPHNTDIRPSYRAIEKQTDLPGMFDSIAVRGDIIAANVFSVVNQQTVVLYNLQTGREQIYVSPQQVSIVTRHVVGCTDVEVGQISYAVLGDSSSQYNTDVHTSTLCRQDHTIRDTSSIVRTTNYTIWYELLYGSQV